MSNRRADELQTAADEGFTCKWHKYNTCSLFLIQQDAIGGLPVKWQVTRAVCPASAWKSLGEPLNCSAGPAKTQHLFVARLPACWPTVERKNAHWKETTRQIEPGGCRDGIWMRLSAMFAAHHQRERLPLVPSLCHTVGKMSWGNKRTTQVTFHTQEEPVLVQASVFGNVVFTLLNMSLFCLPKQMSL